MRRQHNLHVVAWVIHCAKLSAVAWQDQLAKHPLPVVVIDLSRF